MDVKALASLVQVGGRIVSGLLQTYGMRQASPAAPKVELDETRVSTDETISYQKRELAKELTLLEGHLQQGCRINEKPCDCCTKHPMKIEALAQETAGMTPDPVFKQLAAWAQDIAPITTEAAAASGKYDNEYPRLAIAARDFRKAIMPQAKEAGGEVSIP